MNIAIVDINTNIIKNIVVGDSVEIVESVTGPKAVEIPEGVTAYIGLTYTEENGFEQLPVEEVQPEEQAQVHKDVGFA